MLYSLKPFFDRGEAQEIVYTDCRKLLLTKIRSQTRLLPSLRLFLLLETGFLLMEAIFRDFPSVLQTTSLSWKHLFLKNAFLFSETEFLVETEQGLHAKSKSLSSPVHLIFLVFFILCILFLSYRLFLFFDPFLW